MEDILEKIVKLSCEALREEDAYLRDCLSGNPAYSADKNGLLSINNERYYQFVIARHLFKVLPKRIALESSRIDLVVLSDEDPNKYDVVVEMKRWMSSTGNTEIPGIRDDFEKLSKSKADHTVMLVFSSNPSNTPIDENLDFLSKKIDRNVIPSRWKYDQFETIGINGVDNTFWVAGYEV
ncbi:hypothetical protein [Teredinibacter sp. KSP-S5-2]|uniref:hypothetical protein n=1 Tax=Teredinibacter sp. KSP-S5-2 TaxID=3034506 RepID=UPI00293437F0|nr:hypothetical protein [Teredinibacter sp. KSP-S5-2]WNO11287.1 hypothetical protein P5V12_08895 [Teredinibacter sp. KSP-S5-2]